MIDLRPEHYAIVQRILTQIVPQAEVFAFGSRVTGTAREHSDLDLLIKAGEKIDRKTLAALREAFENSDLPFRVDVVEWTAISSEFRSVVEQQTVVRIKEAEVRR